jgi:hypothetical protein
MAKQGKHVRCTWFENARRCPGTPVEPHYDKAGELWAFLCMAHHYELEKTVRTGTAEEIRRAMTKAQGRKKKPCQSGRQSRSGTG